MSDKPRNARPWDLFNKNLGRVETTIAAERYEICSACPELIKLTGQCKKCGCFMQHKAKLPNAFCPLDKWQAVSISYTKDQSEEDAK